MGPSRTCPDSQPKFDPVGSCPGFDAAFPNVGYHHESANGLRPDCNCPRRGHAHTGLRDGLCVCHDNSRGDLRPSRANLRPWRAKLSPWRVDLNPCRANLRPCRAKLSPFPAKLRPALRPCREHLLDGSRVAHDDLRDALRPCRDL